jgi:hypothetical protein
MRSTIRWSLRKYKFFNCHNCGITRIKSICIVYGLHYEYHFSNLEVQIVITRNSWPILYTKVR